MRLLGTTLLLLLSFGLAAQTGDDAARLAQQQLDAYNKRDIEAFLAPYSDSVKIYNHPDQLLYTGKAKMRTRYGAQFQNNPDLHCTLMNRMVLGNVVVDQESVIFSKDRPLVKVIAMYKMAHGKIAEVYFIRPDQ